MQGLARQDNMFVVDSKYIRKSLKSVKKEKDHYLNSSLKRLFRLLDGEFIVRCNLGVKETS